MSYFKNMKYRNKTYKWYSIMFQDGKPLQVDLYEIAPWDYRSSKGKVVTYWDNELLTNKPDITPPHS